MVSYFCSSNYSGLFSVILSLLLWKMFYNAVCVQPRVPVNYMNTIDKWAILGFHAMSIGNSLPTFPDNVFVPETSVRNYHYSLRSSPEERSSHLLPGVSLKSYQNVFVYRQLEGDAPVTKYASRVLATPDLVAMPTDLSY
jgi:hypothetical protein